MSLNRHLISLNFLSLIVLLLFVLSHSLIFYRLGNLEVFFTMSFVNGVARNQYLYAAKMQFEGEVNLIDQNIYQITTQIFQVAQQLNENDPPGSPRERQIQGILQNLARISDQLQLRKKQLESVGKAMEAETASVQKQIEKGVEAFKLMG